MAGWIIGTVTLPYNIERIDIGGDPKTEDFALDGDEPIVEVVAPATLDLTLYGSVALNGGVKATMFSTYIAGLLSQRGTSISVTDPEGTYSGTYYMNCKITDESIGNFIRFRYAITLRVVTSVNVL